MGINFRRVLSVLLTFVLLISSFVWNTAFADNNNSSSASFYGVYNSYMLFQQNEPIVICGKARKGNNITVKLTDGNKNTVRTASAKTAEDGSFKVTLSALNGSYKEYTLTGYCNDIQFKKLTNIVIGELWLCAGQSNMQYPLENTSEGQKILENESGDYYIRGLYTPTCPSNKPFASADERTSIPGSYWVTGNDENISSITAVGYFFAQELRKKKDVPVGILSVALGGSSIFSWLSRSAIDGNKTLSDYLKTNDKYISSSEISSKIKNLKDAKSKMTYAYNQKVAPLKNFNISGTIWYQGEKDIDLDSEIYSEALKTLQQTYSKTFDMKSTMPLICANLASYHYDKGKLQQVVYFNEAQASVTKQNKYISSIPIYDISVDYSDNTETFPGAIHPMNKEDIGKRMAKSALSMVYGEKNPTTAATVKSVTINGNEMLIEFDNVGNGLKIKNGDTTLYGFTICGKSGVYVEARATIENTNTVKIWSENVDHPESATYAYSEVTLSCNLFSSDKNGKDLYPVASFNTKKFDSPKYMQTKDWSTCEIASSWHTLGHSYAGYFNTWYYSGPKSLNSSLRINKKEKAYGTGSLELKFNGTKNKKTELSISPLMMSDGKLFSDINTNYTDIMTMTFKVKNNSDKTVTIDRVDFRTETNLSYSPSVNGETKTHYSIPANSDWVEIQLDLNALYLNGNTSSVPLNNNVLKQVTGIDFVFSHLNFGSDVHCEVLVDDIMFSTEDSEKASEQDLEKKISGFNKTNRHVHTVLEEITEVFNSFENCV